MRFDREATLDWLRGSPRISVLVVGGGINGAGVLRELALNGIDALLVDKQDFAAGATGASSRMIHGGLRYLEYGEFRLVREALRERNRLLRHAPHCVHPLATTIPLFTRFSGFTNSARRFLKLGGKPSQRGSWLVRVGLEIYRTFAGSENPLPAHEFTSRDEARRQRPALHPDVIGTATYFDAWNPRPERLCLEVIRDALQASRECRALNYCQLVRFDGGAVELRDQTNGATFRARPRIVVNAGGAWIDQVNGSLKESTAFIGGTKGSHLVVDHPGLLAQTRGGEIFYENADGRICLIFPLHGRVLVGTTDIPIDDPDEAVCTTDEFNYLVAAVQQVFPQIEIRSEHVVSRFCGVRPLPVSVADNPGAVSRDHRCHVIEAGDTRAFPIFNLIGGKWTTFRAFAEQTVDRLLPRLGANRTRDSKELPIGGGAEFPRGEAEQASWKQHVATSHGLPRPAVDRLFERYGTEAAKIATHLAAAGPDALDELAGYYGGELDFLLRHEAVIHLDDLLLRRTTLALFTRLDESTWRRLASICGRSLGWSPDRTAEEDRRCRQILEQRHGISIGDRSVS